ncbi:MAG: phosphomannomutase [Cognatishimia sp.]|uniref:phosphomannomutase n=1 Tax=Cognatishimia sp. TaxID=2211648 RepID=UPI003B8D314C
MAPKFGTSGVRGLVTELTEACVSDYVRSFASQCETGGTVYVGWDLRESSPAISEVVIETLRQTGNHVVSCGALPTPALAYQAQMARAGAIMITGSHIPADRNGIKFYTTSGEISKDDEARIVSSLGQSIPLESTQGTLTEDGPAALALFQERYCAEPGAFDLSGLKVGVYQHSSVARDLLVDVLQKLGAEVVALERTASFVPVDTEAMDPQSRRKFAAWCHEHKLDALLSTDGDADRPMLTDAQGDLILGDVLGAITASFLKADVICTPVSSNSMVNHMSMFKTISLTKIGSPYVVAAMETAQEARANCKVVGFEANGGFLLGFRCQIGALTIAPLLTRDCILPMIATLAAANQAQMSIAELVATLPPVCTAADRLVGVPTEKSKAFIATLTQDVQARSAFFDVGSEEQGVNTLDGLRVSFAGGEIVHLRPSGNAPEFRCYAEAGTSRRAAELVQNHLNKIGAHLAGE